MKGFTLIEMAIVAAILGILLAIAIPAYQDYQCRSSGKSNCGKTTNQIRRETECINGYAFVKGVQVRNENGGGVACQQNLWYNLSYRGGVAKYR